MNEQPEHTPSRDAPPRGIWGTWAASQILGLFFLFLSGNFFFQYVIYVAVGGVFWPVIGGGILGVFLPLALILRVSHLDLKRDFFLDQPPWQILAASVLMAVATLVPTSMLAELSLRLTPADPEAAAFMQKNMPTSAPGMVLAVISVVLVAPLAEEIIFRGLLCRLASTLWGPLAATAVSSLVFGILHGEAWILFGLIGVGAILALVFEATRSVTACWATHAAHNAISLYFMIRRGPAPIEPSPITAQDWAWTAISMVAVVFIGKYLLAYRPSK